MAYAKKRKARSGSRTRRRSVGTRKSPVRRARSSTNRRSARRNRSHRSPGVIRLEIVSAPAQANVLTDPLMAQKAPMAIKKAMF